MPCRRAPLRYARSMISVILIAAFTVVMLGHIRVTSQVSDTTVHLRNSYPVAGAIGLRLLSQITRTEPESEFTSASIEPIGASELHFKSVTATSTSSAALWTWTPETDTSAQELPLNTHTARTNATAVTSASADTAAQNTSNQWQCG